MPFALLVNIRRTKLQKKDNFHYLCVDFMVEKQNNLSNGEFLSLLDRLRRDRSLTREDWRLLIETLDEEQDIRLRQTAGQLAAERFGKGVYIRGLIEISSYCHNDCYYCGLRRSNRFASRYRLTLDDILGCCWEGASLGFSTFVLQGGEDDVQNDEWIAEVVRAIKREFPSCAVTLSVGERSEAAYRMFREAGADRYLLRHETSNPFHYARLHPVEMSQSHRMDCLNTLKRLGFQTGAGMMIGSPGQTIDCLIDDMEFLERLRPEMIGIGPFIPAAHTPFAGRQAGSVALTLRMVALLRLRFPDALIPATTALATLSATGREDAILSGANVVMPNLSPSSVRGKYSIYDHKAFSGSESAEALRLTEQQLTRIGYHITYGRGDYEPDLHKHRK